MISPRVKRRACPCGVTSRVDVAYVANMGAGSRVINSTRFVRKIGLVCRKLFNNGNELSEAEQKEWSETPVSMDVSDVRNGKPNIAIESRR
jgi:hypothetical protein